MSRSNTDQQLNNLLLKRHEGYFNSTGIIYQYNQTLFLVSHPIYRNQTKITYHTSKAVVSLYSFLRYAGMIFTHYCFRTSLNPLSLVTA